MSKTDELMLETVREAQEVERDAVECVRKALRRGRQVHWDHGSRVFHGTIIEPIQKWMSLNLARVKIRSSTGKEYWIYAYRIIDGMFPGWREA